MNIINKYLPWRIGRRQDRPVRVGPSNFSQKTP
jgi:hypothetical protein